MNIEKQRRSLRESIFELCDIPKDAALGFPVLTVIGKKEVLIENYRGILEYNDILVRIITTVGQIQVTGKNLSVLYYTDDEMKINGQIHTIEYM